MARSYLIFGDIEGKRQSHQGRPFNAYGSSAQDSEYPADVVSAKRFTAWLVEAKPHIIRPIRVLQ